MGWPSNGDTNWNTAMKSTFESEHNNDGTHTSLTRTTKVVKTSAVADSTTATNPRTSPFRISEGKEAFNVTIGGLTVGDVIEVEAFAVLGSSQGDGPYIGIFVDAVSASLAVGANDADQVSKGICSVGLKAWFTATSTSHTFSLRFTGVSGTTHLNDAYGDTNISWISAERWNTNNITVS